MRELKARPLFCILCIGSDLLIAHAVVAHFAKKVLFLKKKKDFCKPNSIYFLVVLKFKLNFFKEFASKNNKS